MKTAVNRLARLALLIGVPLLWPSWLSAQASPVDLTLDTGQILRVECVAADIIRVRLSSNGVFEPSLMERYGVVRTDWPKCEFTSLRETDGWRISTPSGGLRVRASDGRMELLDGQGQTLCAGITPDRAGLSGAELQAFKKRQAALAEYFQGEKRALAKTQPALHKPNPFIRFHEFEPADGAFGATFSIRDGERFHGLGTASAHRVQLRGHGYRLWTQRHDCLDFKETPGGWEQNEGPIPLLLSTGGWGVFVNTTWVHYWDIGRYERDKAIVWGPGGQLDLYLLVGKTLPRQIELYTEITGRPRLLPLFGYGLSYVGQTTQNEHETLTDARLFRDRGIPCDIMGLEPQWMKKNYDGSHTKEWNPDKFYMPDWMGPESKSQTFIGGLGRIGFKLSLWLVCNDDLTMEEERQVAIREGRGQDFSAEPDAWFNHLEKFVRQGVRCFKMDPQNIIEEHATRAYFNGRSDLENHNLTQVLYHKQMTSGFEQLTGQRAMNHYCAAYAGVQRWGATTMGDNGGGTLALSWMLNYAMSGHMNTSCDLEALGPGIHFGFLQPWSQHNNWANAHQPWFLGKQREAMYREYARLRYSLLPYIYSAAHVGHRTSLPIIRPMPLAYPDDPRLSDCTTQYMLGDSLLVVAFSDRVLLPAGRWIDYWTGTEYRGAREMPCTYPKNRAGGLFIKGGAIIPYWPELDFVAEEPVKTIRLHLYPEGKSEYTLYEDDGDSLEYLQGAVATTLIGCQATASGLELTIHPRQGSYRGMPSERSYEVWIHTPEPGSVSVTGGGDTPKAAWTYDSELKALRVQMTEGPERKTPISMRCGP